MYGKLVLLVTVCDFDSVQMRVLVYQLSVVWVVNRQQLCFVHSRQFYRHLITPI